MNYNKIKNIAEAKQMTLRQLCRKGGVSEQGFYKMIKTGSMRIDVLEKIADVLQVPVSYFFEEGFQEFPAEYKVDNKPPGSSHDGRLIDCEKELELLHQLLASKDEIIHQMKKRLGEE